MQQVECISQNGWEFTLEVAHIPRVGEQIVYNHRRYTVTQVSHNFDEQTITVNMLTE